MSWGKWFLVGWMAYGALSVIAQVGKYRKPITAMEAVIATVISAAVAWIVVIA